MNLAIHKRVGIAVVVLAIVSFVAFEVTLISGRQKARESATSFCTKFKPGLPVQEALALMHGDATIKDIHLEPDSIFASFGSGCRCPIRIRQDKVYPDKAWCDF